MSSHREQPAWMKENSSANVAQYRVTLGHVSVTVEGHTDADALRHARHRLCLEMPRLWDVIETSEPGRFGVQRLS